MNKALDKTTLVIISMRNTIVLNSVQDIKVKIFQIFIKRNKPHSIYNLKGGNFFRFKNLSNIGKIKLGVIGLNGEVIPLELPLELEERLSLYLKNKVEIDNDISYHNSSGFDCDSFVTFLNNWDPNSRINATKTSLEELESLTPGTTIMTYDKMEGGLLKGNHFGILLGEGLVLSKFGSTGELVVTTISELRKIYSFENITIVTKDKII